MRQCYCPCSCSRCSGWALTGKRAWNSWRASPSWSWGCCGWKRARTGRLFGDLCSGAPAAGAGRFPPVVADTLPPDPSPTGTAAEKGGTRHLAEDSCSHPIR